MTLKPSAASKLEWFKSSYSDSNEINDCIEVAWAKSSYSGQGNGNECVEIATTPDTIHIRDSKNTAGPHVHAQPAAWAAFVAFASR